jgi:N-acetylmuramoyl-L-alanine amidase
MSIIIFNPCIYVKAEVPNAIINIESPVESSEQGGDVLIYGYSLSMYTVNKINIYVDSVYVGQADYGLLKSNIPGDYVVYPNYLNSGFNFKLNTRGYNDGIHEIKIESIDNSLNKIVKSINVYFKNQRTPIMGQAIITREQMIKYFQQNNSIKDFYYINNFTAILIEEAGAEGVRADIAFVQMMKETNFLKFTGTVKEEQNNFAGIGATGGTVTGASFPDIRTGIRAVIQHLKAYASKENLTKEIVDPRFKYVTRGTAPYVEWLGIKENPGGYGWASDLNYGYDIVSRLNKAISTQVVISKARIDTFTVSEVNYTYKPISISASASASNKVLYKFWIRDASTENWQVIQEYSQNNTINWTMTKPGTYEVAVHVRDQFSNSVDDYSSKIITIKSSATLSNFNIPSEAWTKQSTIIEASATSGNKVLYRFWVGDLSTGKWEIVQDYSENSKFTWLPTKPGKYGIAVHVKDEQSTVVDDYSNKEIIVKQSAELSSFNVPLESWTRQSTTISAKATSGSNVQYKFWIRDMTLGNWQVVQDYSEKSTFTWTPSKAGKYEIAVHVKDQQSTVVDDYSIREIIVKQSAMLSSFDVPLEIWTKQSIIIGASATSANKTLYRFWIGDLSTENWEVVQEYSERNTFTWTPSKSGKYVVAVHVKDQQSGVVDDYSNKEIIVKQGAALSSFSIPTEGDVGKSTIITANATAINKPLYRFWIRDIAGGNWEIVQDYSEKNTFAWTPIKPGKYEAAVHVKDIQSTIVDDYSNKEIIVKSNAVLSSFSIPTEGTVGKSTIIAANATATNKPLYRFWIRDMAGGNWEIVQDYSDKNTFAWAPIKPGKYEAAVHVKDIQSTIVDDYSNKEIIVKSNAVLSSFSIPTEGTVGKSTIIVANATATNKPLYRFWIRDMAGGNWEIVQDYGERNTFAWIPTKPGKYEAAVHVKDIQSTIVDDYSNKEIIVKSNAVLSSFSIPTEGTVGKSTIIAANATSTNKPLYRFWIRDMAGGNWEIVQDYSDKNTFSWTPVKSGKYGIAVHVKDIKSTIVDDYSNKEIVIKVSGLLGKTIVLDAGHGGTDPGAVGNGYKEKDLNIQIVQKLGEKLKNLGANVLYTRQPSNDIYIDLASRAKFANDNNADLFLSIHHDSSTSYTANGTSTHYSTFRPGIETDGAYIDYNGKRYQVLYENNGTLYYNDNGVTKSVSINNVTAYDATPSEAAAKSASLAETLVDALSGLGVADRGSRDHNLYVTRWTNMPSVLIETGFVSNLDEITKIASPSYQDQVAERITSTLLTFFNN